MEVVTVFYVLIAVIVVLIALLIFMWITRSDCEIKGDVMCMSATECRGYAKHYQRYHHVVVYYTGITSKIRKAHFVVPKSFLSLSWPSQQNLLQDAGLDCGIHIRMVIRFKEIE